MTTATKEEKAVTEATKPSPRDGLIKLRDFLRSHFYEREEIIDGLLAGLLARVHMLMVGPPGTGKTELARLMCRSLGLNFFQTLMTKFTAPQDLFGPLDYNGFRQGKPKTVTANGLTEAHVALLDEFFKSSSAGANTLLWLLCDRFFRDVDGTIREVPLQSAIACSNEFPTKEELGAMNDRWVLRYLVDPIREDGNFESMMKSNTNFSKLQPPVALDLAALEEMQREAAATEIPADLYPVLTGLRRSLAAEGILLSDRRWKVNLKLIRVVAYIRHAGPVRKSDLDVLQNTCWLDPAQREKAQEVVLESVNPLRKTYLALKDEIDSVVAALDMKDAGQVTEARQKLKALHGRVKEALGGSGGSDDVTELKALAEHVKAEHARVAMQWLEITEGDGEEGDDGQGIDGDQPTQSEFDAT